MAFFATAMAALLVGGPFNGNYYTRWLSKHDREVDIR
jgi:hypothetical protein